MNIKTDDIHSDIIKLMKPVALFVFRAFRHLTHAARRSDPVSLRPFTEAQSKLVSRSLPSLPMSRSARYPPLPVIATRISPFVACLFPIALECGSLLLFFASRLVHKYSYI
jgi:hypothetical protein